MSRGTETPIGPWALQSLDADGIEREVAEGRSVGLLELARDAQWSAPPDIAFSLGRAAEEEQDFEVAERLFERAAESVSGTLRSRAMAHLAHLDYYAGHFAQGLERALRVAEGASGIARLESYLAASVNAIALNRSAASLAHATRARNATQRIRDPIIRADARFRITRQLVHVLVARGQYREAWSEAEAAEQRARGSPIGRLRAVACYLSGYVSQARGDRICLAYYREAAAAWPESSRAFGRWLMYVTALAHRDLGDATLAGVLKQASGIALPWEDPLFERAAGSEPVAKDPEERPLDERPFLLAARGCVALWAGNARAARTDLTSAVIEFERAELHHYRRGASLALAAARLVGGEHRPAAEILAEETPSLVKEEIFRWPWWDRQTTAILGDHARRSSIGVAYWERHFDQRAQAPLTIDQIMRARGLTPQESEVVRTWLATPNLSRAELAGAVHSSEPSVRNHLNRARMKLGCSRERGPEVLRRRIEELIASTPVASLAHKAAGARRATRPRLG